MAFQFATAFALGADAVMFGRPYLYALAAAGEPAVDHLLNQFTEDLTLTLIGVHAESALTLAAVCQRL